MKEEYDFSKGERGKFHDPEATYSLPVYLEPDVGDYLGRLADEQNVDVQELVNEWLRMNIKLVQSARQQA
jgi:hypothetical protein